MGKDPVGAGTFCPLPLLVFYIPPMLKMFSGMEECKITAWTRDKMSLAHAVILHSSMPEMSEECLKYYILCANEPGTVV